MIDMDIIIGKALLGDVDLFFGPLSPGEFVEELKEDTTMPDILVHCGIFPSKSQARKNGWNKERLEVPSGFSQFTIGKLKHKITILNLV